MSRQQNIIEFLSEKVSNFLDFVKISDHRSYTEAERSDWRDLVVSHILKDIITFKKTIVDFEIKCIKEKNIMDIEGFEDAYHEEYKFEDFCCLFEDDTRIDNEIKIIRSVILSSILDNFLSTIGILLEIDSMVENPKLFFEETFISSDDKKKLFRYLDCFHDTIYELEQKILFENNK